MFTIGLNYREQDRSDQFGNVFRFLAPIWDEYGKSDPLAYDVFLMVAVPGL